MNKKLSSLVFVVVCAAHLLMARPAYALGSDDRPASAARLGSAVFASHLPIVVLDLPGAGEQERPGTLTVFDNSSGTNSLLDTPQSVIEVSVQNGDSIAASAKNDYLLELASTGAPASPLSLVGLREDTRWRLQGSVRDKGMLRNGLAYALGQRLFPDAAPRTRFCEVFLKSGDRYEYEGVYILAESAERFARESVNRDDGSFLVEYSSREDRLGENAVRLGNRVFTAVLPAGGAAQAESRRKIGVELSKLESALHATQQEAFLVYESMLDQRSAIDLYILNALMLNALESRASFRIYRNGNGKLQSLPVWDFDEALDNAAGRDYPLPFEEKVLRVVPPSLLERRLPVWRTLQSGGDIRDLRVYPAYQTLGGEHFLWFDRLFLSRTFLTGLYERYHQLRETFLSPRNVQILVDGMVNDLGPALARDWNRWRERYAAADGEYALRPFMDEEGITHVRQTWSYGQDAVKMRRNLREQDAFLMEQMEQLVWMTVDLYDKGTAGNRQAIYAFATIIGMMVLMHLLSKKL